MVERPSARYVVLEYSGSSEETVAMSRCFNVGIFIDKSVVPDWGGTYYYQETLMAALAKSNKDYNDINLKVITNSDSYKNEFLEVIRLPRQTEPSLLTKFKKSVTQSPSHTIPSVNDFLRQNDIHLLYYIQQHIGLTSTYPFIINNWDLAHITAAGFPDVMINYDIRKAWVDEYFVKALAIISDSETGRDEIINYTTVAEDKVFVAPIFPSRLIDLQLDLAEIEAILDKFNLVNQTFLFFPAQFWALKNHYNLIHGFRKAICTGLDCKLVLTGSEKGNYRYIQRLIAELRLEDRIILTGFLTEKEIFAFYKRSRALIFPTLLGPTNMPPLEALYLSCPVLCSNLKGHQEIFGKYSGYFNPLNQDDIADKIIAINQGEQFRNELLEQLEYIKRHNKFNISFCVENIFKMLAVVKNKRFCWE